MNSSSGVGSILRYFPSLSATIGLRRPVHARHSSRRCPLHVRSSGSSCSRSASAGRRRLAKINISNGNPAGSAIPFTPQLGPRFLMTRLNVAAARPNPTKYKNRERHRNLGAMIENVMAHLVRHHFANFRQGALIEKIVVKSDPRRSG